MIVTINPSSAIASQVGLLDLRKLQRTVVDALEDIKGQDIRVFDTTQQTSLFDRVVIVTATSNRQTRALASHLRDQIKAAGPRKVAIEGDEVGEWVLVDLGEIVVHIMQPAIRAYYNLEEIWGAKPVRVRLGAPRASARLLPDYSLDESDTDQQNEPEERSRVAARARPRSPGPRGSASSAGSSSPRTRAPGSGAGSTRGKASGAGSSSPRGKAPGTGASGSRSRTPGTGSSSPPRRSSARSGRKG